MLKSLRAVKPASVVVLLVIAIALPFVYNDFFVYQASQVLVYGIAILGLILLTGFTGTISIGHGAIFGLGAYTTAIGMHLFHLPYGVALLFSILAGAVIGLAIGIPALRLHHIYLALVTLGLSMVFPPILLRFEAFTGGASGYSVPAIEAPAWTGLTVTQWLYFLALIVSIAGVIAMQNLKRSGRGRALRAIERNESMAVAMGVNVSRERVTVFMLSSVYAALAGGLYALVSGAVAPDAFTFALSSNLLIGAVVGGVTSPIGALLGGALVALVPTATATLPNSLPQYIFVGAVLLVVYLRPKGIASIPAGIVEMVHRRRARRALLTPETSDITRTPVPEENEGLL